MGMSEPLWHDDPYGNGYGHSTAYCHRHASSDAENGFARYRRAYTAMRDLSTPPMTIRSRDGMLRLLRTAYGPAFRVRWSWPPVARAHRARGWS